MLPRQTQSPTSRSWPRAAHNPAARGPTFRSAVILTCVALLAVPLIHGCLTPETQRRLDESAIAAKAARAELAAAKARGDQDLAALTIKVLKAESDLAATKEAATKERVNSGLTIADQVLGSAGGILQYFPGIGSVGGLVLTLLGGAVGGMKSKIGGAANA